MSELAQPIVNRSAFLENQRQIKYEILLEKLKQTEIIYSKASMCVSNSLKNLALYTTHPNYKIIQQNEAIRDPLAIPLGIQSLTDARGFTTLDEFLGFNCFQMSTNIRCITKQSEIKSKAILKYKALTIQIDKLKHLLPEGKRLIKEAKLVAKKKAKELAHLEAVNRCFVAADADKRISSARLLRLPEDILIVIKSFFTYETRIELLETKYQMMLRLNKLSSSNTRELICGMHKRPNYLADLSAREAEILILRPYRGVPTNHVKRKEYILSMLQKYKIHCPAEAIHLIKTVALSKKI